MDRARIARANKKASRNSPGGSDHDLVQTPTAGASIYETTQSCLSAQRKAAPPGLTFDCPRTERIAVAACSCCHHPSSDLVMSMCMWLVRWP